MQKNTLFSGSLIDNLRWGDENATLDEIKEACSIACVDEFIDRLPGGLDARWDRKVSMYQEDRSREYVLQEQY